MTSIEITRRPVVEADRPFLFQLYASTRETELERVPWNTEQKHAFLAMQFEGQNVGYREAYPRASHEMICAGGVPAGRLYWSREPDRLHILDITVEPSRRGGGLGSRVIGEILDEGRRDRKPVTIYVEDFNPSCRLFARLGFQVASQDGFQLLLRCNPAPAL